MDSSLKMLCSIVMHDSNLKNVLHKHHKHPCNTLSLALILHCVALCHIVSWCSLFLHCCDTSTAALQCCFFSCCSCGTVSSFCCTVLCVLSCVVSLFLFAAWAFCYFFSVLFVVASFFCSAKLFFCIASCSSFVLQHNALSFCSAACCVLFCIILLFLFLVPALCYFFSALFVLPLSFFAVQSSFFA